MSCCNCRSSRYSVTCSEHALDIVNDYDQCHICVSEEKLLHHIQELELKVEGLELVVNKLIPKAPKKKKE